MVTEAPSTVRARRLRERRAKGVAMVVPTEVGRGGVALQVGNVLRLLCHKPDITLGFLKGITQTAIWPGTCPFLNSDGDSRFRALCRMAKPYRQQ